MMFEHGGDVSHEGRQACLPWNRLRCRDTNGPHEPCFRRRSPRG